MIVVFLILLIFLTVDIRCKKDIKPGKLGCCPIICYQLWGKIFFEGTFLNLMQLYIHENFHSIALVFVFLSSSIL
jgi:hypothetical protein